MTVVDVNTGKFVGSGGNLEQTVTRNNMEAAEEIVRQLRLRDIGGIIVIDFIDMVLESNRDLVLRRLTECLGRDRTKHQVAEVTSLGLVQMTRKRVGQGLLEVFSEPCEHCRGRGVIVRTDPVDEKRRSGGGSGGGNGNGGGGNGRRRRPVVAAPAATVEDSRGKDAGKDGRGRRRPRSRPRRRPPSRPPRRRRAGRGRPQRRPAQPGPARPRPVRRGPRRRGRRRPGRASETDVEPDTEDAGTTEPEATVDGVADAAAGRERRRSRSSRRMPRDAAVGGRRAGGRAEPRAAERRRVAGGSGRGCGRRPGRGVAEAAQPAGGRPSRRPHRPPSGRPRRSGRSRPRRRRSARAGRRAARRDAGRPGHVDRPWAAQVRWSGCTATARAPPGAAGSGVRSPSSTRRPLRSCAPDDRAGHEEATRSQWCTQW